MDQLERQIKVSKMLGMAFVLSITSIFGVGSFVALILGWKALRLIRSSSEAVSGRMMAWWCILAGALGALVITPLTIAEIIEHLNDFNK